MSRPQSATQEAASQLRGDILKGHYQPGARLAETELAESMGMSRTPIREALRVLEADGLVELRPGRGAVVVSPTDDALEILFDLRMQIEGLAAKTAATRLDPEDIDRLDGYARGLIQIVETTRGNPNPEQQAEIYDLNALFHGLIVDVAKSKLLSRTFREMIHMVVLVRTYQAFNLDDLRRSSGHHLELVAAFRARDGAWAESVMHSHLLSARAALLGPRIA